MLEGTIVIDTPKHNFKNIKEAKTWAKENITGIYKNIDTGENISVSRTAIDKYSKVIKHGGNKAYSYEIMQIKNPITQKELSGYSIQSENLEREQYSTSSRISDSSVDKGTNIPENHQTFNNNFSEKCNIDKKNSIL